MSVSKDALKRVPGLHVGVRAVKRLYNAARSASSPYVQFFPAGHFYSPLPDEAAVREHATTLFDRRVTECPGIALRDAHQLGVLHELAGFYDAVPFPESQTASFRYYFDNLFYGYGDAVVLYGMLRRFQPRRVIEVGSGFSSAAMLDTDERFLGRSTAFTFIEPYPERLLDLLTDEDRARCEMLQKPVQEVSLETFDALGEDDLLFIDSSHVVKTGSDVQHLLASVLPRLRPGVVVHFHDVFWPFEYPMEWVLEGRAWNEAYFLRAFLQYNTAFEVEFFNTYVASVHREALGEAMPICLKNPGAGLWLRKIA